VRQASVLLPLSCLLGTALVAVPLAATPLRAAMPIEAPPSSCQILDAAGLPQTSPAAIDFLERCLSRLPQTNTRYTGAPSDKNTRESLHSRIIEAAGKGRVCVLHRPPIAIFTGGAPGAGKTTWLRTYAPVALAPATLRIDADALRALLPEYRGWNADVTQAESGVLVDRQLAGIGRPCRYDLLYDGTMSRADRYRQLIPELRAMGYRVFLLNVRVPESLSRVRVLERYRATGRYVSRAAIGRYFSTGPAPFRTLSGWVDAYLQVDGITGRILKQGGDPFPQSLPVAMPKP
jgi:predicted ABC-type ATPase